MNTSERRCFLLSICPKYFTVLHCTALHCTTLYPVLYCTVLHCTALHCTTVYCTALYYTVLYCLVRTSLYYTSLFWNELHLNALYCELNFSEKNNVDTYCWCCVMSHTEIRLHGVIRYDPLDGAVKSLVKIYGLLYVAVWLSWKYGIPTRSLVRLFGSCYLQI